MKTFFLLLSFFFITGSSRLHAQEDIDIYEIYKDQVKAMLEARGLPPEEVKQLIAFYQGSEKLTDQSIARLLKKLYPANKGVGILFYFYNNDSLHRVFFNPGKLVSHDTITITKEQLLQVNTDLNHALGIYELTSNRAPEKRGLERKPPPGSGNKDLSSNIAAATRLLLPPAFDSSYRHLVIVPALNIGIFPFHLLKPYGDDQYLIDRCSYTVAPALADVFALRVKVLRAALGYEFSMNQDFRYRLDSLKFTLEYPLFVSNPEYPRDGEFSFPDLPGASGEVKFAKELARDYKLLEGKEAVKDSVLTYLSRCDVAYFATHGIADEEKPMEKSFLVLSGEDPYLTGKEIMQFKDTGSRKGMNFPEMVILSACQTGLGRSMEAGIVGLARSFLLKGAAHVIMSLWSVDDKSTAYLMNRFVWYLVKDNPFTPAEPLRRAILDTKKKYPHPSHWASFSLFGVNY